jgi:hypothetical protein
LPIRRALVDASRVAALTATALCAHALLAPPSKPPPRVDGAYIGGIAWGAGVFTRVDGLDTPTPFFGPGGALRAGDVVFPWMTVGVAFTGTGAYASAASVGFGGLLVELGFLPVPRVPLSIRAGFGFGAGAVLPSDRARRYGFGGALFEGALRYEWFPLAARRRPHTGGGWAIGPELGWLGHTPAGPGRPMANTIVLGLWTGFYFGS